jgi:hypothetical protein
MLNKDCFGIIQSYINTPDHKNLSQANRVINNYGWKKVIVFDGNNIKRYVGEFIKHRNSIVCLTIENIRDPQNYVLDWCIKKIYFRNCYGNIEVPLGAKNVTIL